MTDLLDSVIVQTRGPVFDLTLKLDALAEKRQYLFGIENFGNGRIRPDECEVLTRRVPRGLSGSYRVEILTNLAETRAESPKPFADEFQFASCFVPALQRLDDQVVLFSLAHSLKHNPENPAINSETLREGAR